MLGCLVAEVVMASRLVRVNPVTVNDVLDGHVSLDLECPDRLYLNGYLGQLQVGGQVVQFLRHRVSRCPPRRVCTTTRGPRAAVCRYLPR